MAKSNIDLALDAARKARVYRNALVELLAECVERELFTEAQLAAVTGFDLVTVRELIDSAQIDGPRVEDGDDLMAQRVRYGKGRDAIARVLAERGECTTAEMALALGMSSVAASQALRRCGAAVRVRPGVWRLAPNVSDGVTSAGEGT